MEKKKKIKPEISKGLLSGATIALATKATSSFCPVLAVIIISSLVLSFNMLFKGLKNSLMTVLKWHMNFKSSHTPRAFAYSHPCHFTTTDRPNKNKIREKIIKKRARVGVRVVGSRELRCRDKGLLNHLLIEKENKYI